MLSVLGIRHHGPGCGRSVERALERLQPDSVLIEGPPEADALLEHVLDPELVPPVALLVYARDEPGRAGFWPLAKWSPEYRALRWAAHNQRPVRFFDLPQSWALHPDNQLARLLPPVDAIGLLAQAAGSSDGEAWWEDQVELRRDDAQIFEAILEAITAVRELEGGLVPEDRYEAARESQMRKQVRAELKKHEHVAVVCGAFHGPAVAQHKKVKIGEDNARLRGFRKRRVDCAWVPWAASRLSFQSGYGAGMSAPAWYEAIWDAGLADTLDTNLSERWLTRTARLLRSEGLDLSSAHVIEGVRLAEALAAIRARSRPGLSELREATRTVLLGGDDSPMALVRERLEVGFALGHVPQGLPVIPLQKDLETRAKKALLKFEDHTVEKKLDLRKPKARLASLLLHQLRVLGIPWGLPQEVGGSGTFWELWTLKWDPGFAVKIVESGSLGNTVLQAAARQLALSVDKTESLGELAELLDAAILAELPTPSLLKALDDRAAVSADIVQLMQAIPPLVRQTRYGSVRNSPVEAIVPVLERLFERVVLALPGASTQLDDQAAEALVKGLDRVHEALGILPRPELFEDWLEALWKLARRDEVHPLIRGRAARKLLEADALGDQLESLARTNLSTAIEPLQAAWWLEGMLRGSGLVLLHQDALWSVLDEWLPGLPEETFHELLPMLRRAFSGFSKAERREMGKKVRHLGEEPDSTQTLELDPQLGERVLPALRALLGGVA